MGFILNIRMCVFSSFLGKCLRSLHAEGLRLLFVVPGEVSRLLKSSEYLQAGLWRNIYYNVWLVETRSCVFAAYFRGIISECLHCNSNQQHQLLHLCPWRFPHPGGECPSSDSHQHSGRLCPFLRKGTEPAPNTSSCEIKSFTKLARTLFLNPAVYTLRCSSSHAQRSVASWLWTTRGTTRFGSCLCSSCVCSPSWWLTASCLSSRMWWTSSSSASPWTQSIMMAAQGTSTTWTRPWWWDISVNIVTVFRPLSGWCFIKRLVFIKQLVFWGCSFIQEQEHLFWNI